MFSLSNVEVVYDKFFLALKGISMEVPKGSVVGVLGPNGAGKSTLLKSLSGILKTERGEVRYGSIEFLEERVENKDPDYMISKGVIHVLEGRRVFRELTTEENLRTGIYGRTKFFVRAEDYDLVFKYFPELKKVMHLRSGYISGGEQQMLVMARALLTKPRVMLLDEPSLGLAPKVWARVFDAIKQINDEEGITMVIVDQNAKAVLELADHVYVMEGGRIVMSGEPEYLKTKEELKEFYLGIRSTGYRSYKDIKHWKIRRRWV